MTERDKAQPDAESAGLSRRDFVTRTAVAGAGLVIVPRHVLGRGMQAPSDTVNIATVGVSGMGSSNTGAVMSQNIVAFCDVDYGLLDARIERWKKEASGGAVARHVESPAARADGRAARRQRKASEAGFGREPQAVHGRATAEGRAVSRLSRDAREAEGHRRHHRRDTRSHARRHRARRPWISASTSTCRSRCAGRSTRRGRLAKKAKEHPKIVTQMGNQGHSRDEARLGYEYITSGAIGDVREVHVWTNRPLGYWPQGVPRPAPLPARLQDPTTADRAGEDRTSTTGSLRRWSATTRPAISSSWDLSSASRRPSITTRFITRSTGAAGWTGARARSATWART